MKAKFILTFSILNTLSEAKIHLNISLGPDKHTTEIEYFGDDNKLVTDKEIALFKLDKENLKKAMKVEYIRAPDDIFFRDPTPYDDLFKRFRWKEVERHLVINKADVLQVTSEPFVFKNIEYVNNTTLTFTKDINYVDYIESTAVSYWFEKGLPIDEIYYDVQVNYQMGRFKYKNKWRNSSLKKSIVPFGIQKDAHVKIEAGQRINIVITAYKTIVLLRVKYLAKLRGCLIGDYEERHATYHFYCPDVDVVMRAANITNEIVTTEFIEIRGFTRPKLKIVDAITDKNVPLIINN